MHESLSVLPNLVGKRWMRTAVGISAALAILVAGCQPISPDLESGSAPAEAAVEEAAPTESPEAAEAPVALITGLPEITIELTADGIVTPEDVVAGPTIVHVVNNGGPMDEDGSPLLPEVGRFVEGASVEALMATFPEANENPSDALQLVKIYGGIFGPPAQIAWDLQPGEHVALTTADPPAMETFTVTEGDASEAPTSDVQVQLADFSFAMPDKVAAGPQVWELTNVGKQWHELVVMKLNEGVTVEDIFAFFETAGPEDAPPFELIFGYAPFSEGNRVWATIDLPPGEYTVVCFLPDLLSDMSPHVAHGMIRSLTVE